MLTYPDEVWDRLWAEYSEEKASKLNQTGPIVTGDSVVDAWERELYEKFKGTPKG